MATETKALRRWNGELVLAMLEMKLREVEESLAEKARPARQAVIEGIPRVAMTRFVGRKGRNPSGRNRCSPRPEPLRVFSWRELLLISPTTDKSLPRVSKDANLGIMGF